MQHSIYLHIPFCTHRCAYCDFNTYTGLEELVPDYVDALCREVELVGQEAPSGIEAHTVFLGGGTPSLLSAEQVARILKAIQSAFPVTDEAEITLEANPGTVSLNSLQALRAAGANRISLGVQSANGQELRMLERTHDFGEVLRAVADARRAGFDNLNLDLIYGLPEQAVETWLTSLRRVLDLHPEHLSAYCLSLEHGTPFGKWAQRGLMPVPDVDLAADMYDLASQELKAAGYEQYEISNWALPEHQCRHNLQYWRGEPYLGFGAGAHGYAAGQRYFNALAIREYIARVSGRVLDGKAFWGPGRAGPEGGPAFPWSPAAVHRHHQNIDDEMSEYMIMGLRLTGEGVSESRFAVRFGKTLAQVYSRRLAKLAGQGLIETVGQQETEAVPDRGGHGSGPQVRVRLTQRGRLLGNRVFAEFVT
jgi:oxygen-independent coproporphyrinogen-3 oxidase